MLMTIKEDRDCVVEVAQVSVLTLLGNKSESIFDFACLLRVAWVSSMPWQFRTRVGCTAGRPCGSFTPYGAVPGVTG